MSLLLTAIALLLWSHSIVSARFEIGYFGLIHGLPVTFFLGLAFFWIFLFNVRPEFLWLCLRGIFRLLRLGSRRRPSQRRGSRLGIGHDN